MPEMLHKIPIRSMVLQKTKLLYLLFYMDKKKMY